MIFVTVGTHEQQFDRLIMYIDELQLEEEVIIQTGFSTYQPKNCKWSKWLSYDQMIDHVKNARIVICHGGPSSIIMPLQIGKTPIVVPRQEIYKEHVNNHQVDFVNRIKDSMNIIPVINIEDLKACIENYDGIIADSGTSFHGNNEEFILGLTNVVEQLYVK